MCFFPEIMHGRVAAEYAGLIVCSFYHEYQQKLRLSESAHVHHIRNRPLHVSNGSNSDVCMSCLFHPSICTPITTNWHRWVLRLFPSASAKKRLCKGRQMYEVLAYCDLAIIDDCEESIGRCSDCTKHSITERSVQLQAHSLVRHARISLFLMQASTPILPVLIHMYFSYLYPNQPKGLSSVIVCRTRPPSGPSQRVYFPLEPSFQKLSFRLHDAGNFPIIKGAEITSPHSERNRTSRSGGAFKFCNSPHIPEHSRFSSLFHIVYGLFAREHNSIVHCSIVVKISVTENSRVLLLKICRWYNAMIHNCKQVCKIERI